MRDERVVALDFDEVLANLLPRWLELLDCPLDPSEIETWDMVEATGNPRAYDVLHYPDLYDKVEPVKGALEGWRALGELGVTRLIVTSCVDGGMVDGKIRWLKRHGLWQGDKWPPFFFPTTDKSRIQAHALVDDHHLNLRHFGGHRILYTRPYNREVQGYDRVWGWAELPVKLEKLLATLG